jgi:hypothetical protein
MHTVFSITIDGECRQWIRKKAAKDETTMVRIMTLMMRSPEFKSAVKKEKTWIRALESCVRAKMTKK